MLNSNENSFSANYTSGLNTNINEPCIYTTKGMVSSSCITGVLIHEHVFNRFPFRLREKSERFTIDELDNAYKSGINVIVDLTPYTNPYDYYRVIDETSINIVACAGFYTPNYMSPRIRKMSEDELFSTFSKKIEFGVGVRKIKPAILKVAVQKDYVSDIEHKFLRVIGRLSKRYILPVALHAPFSTYSHAIQLLQYGVLPSSLMVAHIENGIIKKDELVVRIEEAKQLASLGCYIQLADFGSNNKTIKCRHTLILMDSLLNAGYSNKILISSDSNWRWRNAKPVLRNSNNGGGRRFTYALTHALPLIQKHTGQDMKQLLFIDNPLQFLGLIP